MNPTGTPPRRQPRIFVSVAAFVDPELESTLRSAVAQAAEPHDLVFGVLNQTLSPVADRLALADLPVRLLQIRPEESHGVCWARSVVQTLYDNEPYFLQIDSHTLFAPQWDRHLRNALEELGDRAILTAYPYGYTRQGSEVLLDHTGPAQTTLVTRPVPHQTLRPDAPILRFQSRHFPEPQTVLGSHISAGCLFTHGRFVQDVPYDPQGYFHGEEQGLTLRAFTRGWDLYHIPDIPLYHHYRKPGESHLGHHWHPRWKHPPERLAYWERRAVARLRDLVSGTLSGVWGLGTDRTLEDFFRISGIDYRTGTLTEPEHLQGRLL